MPEPPINAATVAAEAEDKNHREAGRNWRTVVLPLAIVGFSLLMAGVLVRQDLDSAARLRARVLESNRLRLQSSMRHVEDFFDAVYSTLLFISLDENVAAGRKDSLQYIQKLYEHQWEHHRLEEIYVIEPEFDGTAPPFLTFERAGPGLDPADIHSLAREADEYRVQMTQIRRFAADPALTALMSEEIPLCTPDDRNVRAPGFVYSVPVRSGTSLLGMVSGMLQTRRIREVLREGQREQTAWLVREAGHFVGPVEADDMQGWFRSRFGAGGVAAFFSEAGERFSVRDQTALWAPVHIVAGEQWWLVYLYPENAHRTRLSLGATWGRSFLAGGLVIAGLALGLAVRTIAQRLDEQTRHLRERRQLERQIQAVSEREQRRVGERLQEDLCQRLTGLRAASTALHRQLKSRKLPESEIAGELSNELAECLNRARQMAGDLQPVPLLEHGFVAALDRLAADTERTSGIACRLEGRDVPDLSDTAVATHLYRVVQEALANAVKHGQPTRILVALSASESRFNLTVTDNGKGIRPGALAGDGMGLRIARYRCDLIGAHLAVAPGAEGGTRLHCSWPRPGPAPGPDA